MRDMGLWGTRFKEETFKMDYMPKFIWGKSFSFIVWLARKKEILLEYMKCNE